MDKRLTEPVFPRRFDLVTNLVLLPLQSMAPSPSHRYLLVPGKPFHPKKHFSAPVGRRLQ